MPNMFEVDQNLENAVIYGVDEYGEILPEEELYALVENMQIALNNKMEYIGKLKLNADSDVEIIDKEIKRLQERKKTIQNGSNRAVNYLDKFIRYKYTDMETGVVDTEGLNKFKLKTPTLTISYRKSESLDVIDATKVPKDYVKTTVEEKVDKAELKKFMKSENLTETEYAKINNNLNIQVK